ncbi:hypothetical protein RRG08_014058 [Elysia crispata]|uniref:Uncharacterized protein n=1 Tax=Elysia crispata TaxID=231223 RepID=A0AAE1A0N2_9GAST|nr:hypothetical protein RRG08_014058 [Elysia crispata]
MNLVIEEGEGGTGRSSVASKTCSGIIADRSGGKLASVGQSPLHSLHQSFSRGQWAGRDIDPLQDYGQLPRDSLSLGGQKEREKATQGCQSACQRGLYQFLVTSTPKALGLLACYTRSSPKSTVSLDAIHAYQICNDIQAGVTQSRSVLCLDVLVLHSQLKKCSQSE